MASPLSFASMALLLAIRSVCPALSAFCLMVAVICSIADDISSTLAACSFAPWESSSDEDEICSVPALTLSDDPSMLETTFITDRVRIRDTTTDKIIAAIIDITITTAIIRET